MSNKVTSHGFHFHAGMPPFHSPNDIRYLNDIRKFKPLPLQEQAQLAIKAQKGDEASGNRLTLTNQRLLGYLAINHQGKGVPWLELIQEGNIGIWKAIKSFDISKGKNFPNYARWWIDKRMADTVRNHARAFYLPYKILTKNHKVRKAQNILFQKLQREPTLQEIAKRIRIPARTIKEVLTATKFQLSLETPVGRNKNGKEDEDLVIADRLKDDKSLAPDEVAFREILKKEMGNQLSFLPKREQNVTKLYYGLDRGFPRTFEEVGKDKDINLTRERVRQINTKVLKKLAHNRKLMEYRQKPKLKERP